MKRGSAQFLRQSLAPLWAALLLTLVGVAHASDPLVRVMGNGACPSAQQVQMLIDEWSVRQPVEKERLWLAEVTRVNDQVARLRLRSPEGELLLERSIQSTDCDALANAFAIILETHFLDLGLIAPREPAAEAPPPPRPKSAVKGVPPTEPEAESDAVDWRLGVGIGAQLGLPEPGATGAAHLFVAPVFSEVWALQVTAIAGLAQTQSAGEVNDRIQSQGFDATLTLGYRSNFDHIFWLEPRLGGGVRITRARALDIDADSATSVRPVAQLGLAGGIPLSPKWSLRFDVLGDLVLNRDNYAIDPYGTVGTGPRGLIFALFGVEFTQL